MRCLKARTQFGFCKRSFSPCPSPAAHMGYNVCSNDHNGTKWQAGQKAQGCVSPDSEQHRETLSASLSTPSACPIPLLVNMHASNTHKKHQAPGFWLAVVSCTVLCNDGVTQWLAREAKTRGREKAHTSRHASLSGFKNAVSSSGLFRSQTTGQSSIKPEPRRQIHPGRLFHLADNLRPRIIFPLAVRLRRVIHEQPRARQPRHKNDQKKTWSKTAHLCDPHGLNQWRNTKPFSAGQIEYVSPTKAVAPLRLSSVNN